MSYASPPPPHQQQYQYPPPQQAHSPANTSAFHPPPAKRQRLSPVPGAPHVQPYRNGNATYHTPPSHVQNHSYGPTYPHSASYSPNGYVVSPQSSFNTPQPHPYNYPQNTQGAWQSQPATPASAVQRSNAASPQPSSAMMPPPPRPNKEEREEKVGVEDLGDALFGSGINLKDEEAALSRSYRDSFESTTLSGGNSFELLTQSANADTRHDHLKRQLGNLAPRFEQTEVDLEVAVKRQAAARAKAEKDQHHLNNPFLLGNVLRLRVDHLARECGVSLDVSGMYIKNRPEPATSTTVMMNGDDTQGIVMADSKIDHGVPFAEVLSLISLAANERMRNLIDEAHALARARRYGDHGRVPPEFADLATGDGERRTEELKPENISNSPWDRVEDDSQALPTISHQSRINTTLRALASRDAEAETLRLKKRALRAARLAETTPKDEDTLLPDVLLDPSTSAADNGPKISKKEAIRLQKEAKSKSEETIAQTTNQTANMMMGGRKGKQYAWMTGGSTPGPTNRFAKAPATPSATTPVPGTPTGTPSGAADVASKDIVVSASTGRQWGEWSELDDNGKGIQGRDWVLVLERDGRERKALQKALLNLGVEKKAL